MKATVLALEQYNQPLVRREVEIPALAKGQVLVKLTAAGVCGSDVHMWKGEDSRLRLPMVLGHEGVGIVAALGGPKLTIDGKELHEGDPVIWNRGVSCGECYYCKVLKETSFCPRRKVVGINLSLNDPPYLNGCFADHIILAEGTDFYLIPPGIDPAVLVTASCSGATAAHAFDLVRPEPGETVVIIGPGPLGLFAVALAKAYGAGQVVLTGGSQSRLGLGKVFGADLVLDRNKLSAAERRELIFEITGGRGADMIVETSGTAAGLEEAIGLTRMGGSVLSVGASQPGGTFLFDGFEDLTRRNLRLQGVWVSDARHFDRAVRLVLNNPDLFAKMVTHRFRLSQANEALAAVDRREAVKAILLPD